MSAADSVNVTDGNLQVNWTTLSVQGHLFCLQVQSGDIFFSIPAKTTLHMLKASVQQSLLVFCSSLIFTPSQT